MPYLLRSISVATTRVDTYYNSLNIVVVHKTLKVLAHGRRGNRMVCTHGNRLYLVLHNIAKSIVNSNLVAVHILFLGVEHIAYAELRNGVVVLKLEHLLYGFLYFVGVHHAVYHLALYKRLGRRE